MRTPGAILVAETNHAVSGLITEILRDDGYTVRVAHARTATLASIAKHQTALILLDDHIDRLNTARLHAHIACQHHMGIPISTNPAVAAILTGRDSRACLVKPFSLDALVAHARHYAPLA
jgi:DNA-binding response OmpR family regulator